MCIHVVYMLICTLMKVCIHIKMHACENLRLSSRIFLSDSLLDKLFEAGALNQTQSSWIWIATLADLFWEAPVIQTWSYRRPPKPTQHEGIYI